jgi:beta-lactamase class A
MAAGRPVFAVAASEQLAAVERRLGGRLGVAALDTHGGFRLAYRASERFAMCSTFKLLASAATLARVDAKQERLDRLVRYTEQDVIENAPIAKEHVADGMTIEALMAAAMTHSDNTAANLLLASLGGPHAVTAFARRIGDTRTRLDRNELSLNDVPAGDPRDTTTPESMVHDLRALLVDARVLSAASRERLTAWMVGNTTGADRIRAGVPADWRVGDKTGTGPHGAANDVAIVWPPNRPPVLIAAYSWGTSASTGDQNRALADVGRVVAANIRA